MGEEVRDEGRGVGDRERGRMKATKGQRGSKDAQGEGDERRGRAGGSCYFYSFVYLELPSRM